MRDNRMSLNALELQLYPIEQCQWRLVTALSVAYSQLLCSFHIPNTQNTSSTNVYNQVFWLLYAFVAWPPEASCFWMSVLHERDHCRVVPTAEMLTIISYRPITFDYSTYAAVLDGTRIKLCPKEAQTYALPLFCDRDLEINLWPWKSVT